MSHSLRATCRLAGLAAFGALVAACPAHAETASRTFRAVCDFPLVGESEFTANVVVDLPRFQPGIYSAVPFTISLTSGPGADGHDAASDGLSLLKTKTVGGVATSTVFINGGGFDHFDIHPMATFPSVPFVGTAPVTFSGSGTFPSLRFPKAGWAQFDFSRVDLNLRAVGTAPITRFATAQTYPDSDGDLTTFDVPCALTPPPAPFDFQVMTIGLPPTPTPLSTGDPIPTPTPTPTGLPPRTPTITPTPTASPTVNPTPTPTPTGLPPRTPTITPPPTPSPTSTLAVGVPVPTTSRFEGSATLKTLTKGTVPLRGSLALTLDLQGAAARGPIAFEESTASLVALGLLPVKATIAVVPQGDATGSFDRASGKLALAAKVRIKLPRITLFGLQLAGGSGCQTKNVSALALTSTAAFDPFAENVLTGTFGISDLTNCGALTNLVSPLTAGGGNAIALRLAPRG